MRRIELANDFRITFTHAANNSEAITRINIKIPLDGNKYMQGKNIIECIQEKLLPNIEIANINQALSDLEIAKLQSYLLTQESDIFFPPLFSPQSLGVTSFQIRNKEAINWLMTKDNSFLGYISQISALGIVYT